MAGPLIDQAGRIAPWADLQRIIADFDLKFHAKSPISYLTTFRYLNRNRIEIF